MRRPRNLYRYSVHHELEKHECLDGCAPQLIARSNQYGPVWRCRGDRHDFSGYETRKQAKLEEVDNLKNEIQSLHGKLLKLGCRVGLRWVWNGEDHEV